jgi:pSer/pThr/pTyr-binding forkhead associated (FHA) protein
MRDGHTQRLERQSGSNGWERFCDQYHAKLVVVVGPEAGSEFAVDRNRVILGRGPGVHVVLPDPAISRQHAAVEYVDGGFRVMDLGSTNGVRVDGELVQAATLDHGQRFEIGDRELLLVVEEREDAPEVYEIEV